jgi:sulfoxide reductase catalytic subunit YedY
MLIKHRKGWELPESLVTPEHMFLNRRKFMGAAAGAAAFYFGRTSARRR